MTVENTAANAAIDHTVRDYDSMRAAMLRWADASCEGWTDRSPGGFGMVMLELFAYVGDVLLHYQDRIADESFPDTAVERRSVVDLLRLIGYELASARPARADLEVTFKPSLTPTATIPRNAVFKGAGADGDVLFRYLGEDVVVKLDTSAEVCEQIAVEQTDRSETNKVLGSSDGSPWQRMRIADALVVDESVIVTTDEGGAAHRWEVRDTLADSNAADEHLTLRRDADGYVWVEFGDNRTGRIPPAGVGNVLVAYRVGGGARGNVAAGQITEAVTSLGDAFDHVTNVEQAAGGTDPETIESAKARSAAVVRAKDRAVTAADFEALALRFGLGKARAVAQGWGRIVVFVAPKGGGYLPETLRMDVERHLDERRMLTCAVHVERVSEIAVYIKAEFGVIGGADPKRVRSLVEAAARDLLAFDRVELGASLYLSKVYEAMERIPEVRFVTVTGFSRDTEPGAEDPPSFIRFDASELPRTGYASGAVLEVRSEPRQ